MCASDNDSGKNGINQKLRKDEILRGHKVFSSILQNSGIVTTDLLNVFIAKNSEKVQFIKTAEFNQSPLLTENVKVGFIIAKKKIRKAVLRNRIRRLLRESYRLNKFLFNEFENTDLLFSLNEKGYNHFKINPKEKRNIFDIELKNVSEKISKYLKKQ